LQATFQKVITYIYSYIEVLFLILNTFFNLDILDYIDVLLFVHNRKAFIDNNNTKKKQYKRTTAQGYIKAHKTVIKPD